MENDNKPGPVRDGIAGSVPAHMTPAMVEFQRFGKLTPLAGDISLISKPSGNLIAVNPANVVIDAETGKVL
ncbi:MAG: hypothetical protein EBU96_06750 [Actinobacteria bacterium]|nr:hypothetical protein [Actinomycetota bacterium]